MGVIVNNGMQTGDGSFASPSITYELDTDLGFWRAGADTIGLRASAFRVRTSDVASASGLGTIQAASLVGAYVSVTDGTRETLIGADGAGSHIGAYTNNNFAIRQNNIARMTFEGNTTRCNATNFIVDSGDLYSFRAGGTTGVLYLTSGQGRFLHWDGTNYQLNGAPLNVGSNYKIDGVVTLERLSNYTRIYDASGSTIGIHIGNAGDPKNYFRNTEHAFQDIPGTATFMSLTGSALTVNVTSNFNAPVNTGNINTASISASGNLNVTGNATVNAAIFAGGDIVAQGGTCYLNAAQTRYLDFNGSLYVLGGAGLHVQGAIQGQGVHSVAHNTYELGNSANYWVNSWIYGQRLWTQFAIWNEVPTNSLVVYAVGDGRGVFLAYGGQAWAAWSDVSLKKNIKEYSVLDRLEKFRCVTWDWNEKLDVPAPPGGFGKRPDNIDDSKIKTTGIGAIGQECLESFPEIVDVGANGKIGVSYSLLGPIAMQGVKELHAEYLALKQRVALLEKPAVTHEG